MSNNLLESLKEYLSGDVVSNLAALIGESPKSTESALLTALPSLLAGLVDKSADTKSIGDLFKLLIEGNHDGGVLSNLGALSRGGDETTKLMSEGASLLASLFSDKVAAIANLAANASGISKDSSSSLLNFVTPLALGLIGRKIKIEKITDPAGLAKLLSEQSGFLKDFIPVGLSSLVDIPKTTVSKTSTVTNTMSDFDKAAYSLDDDTPSYIQEKTASVTDALSNISNVVEDAAEEALSDTKNLAEDMGGTASQFGSHIVEETKEFAHSAAEIFEESTNKGQKFLPWILIAAALALVWGLLKSCSIPETTPETTAPSVTAPSATTPPPTEPAAVAPTVTPAPSAPPGPAKAETPATDSNFYEKTLSTGYAIKASKDGLENKLVSFIESNEAINKDLWFTMDGVQFDTSKATIRSESDAQINHIAEVLKAFPKVKIKIGGYTDNTGNAKANKKLSNDRANAIKTAIASKSIAVDRMDAEGYGSDHPVASNDTPEGQQQNRRIDVRVTEK